MGVTAAIKTTLFYIIYPVIPIYHACLIILSPVLHIIEHIGRLTILPLSFLSKFEVRVHKSPLRHAKPDI